MLGGGGGCWACFRSGPISVGGGGGAAKGLLPCFLVPKGNQPTACTLALWWLKFGPTEGFVWGGVGRALLQFMHFSAIFAMLAVLATSVTLWYPL